MRNLGLDVGDKRVGIALSDSDEILASPFKVIERDEGDEVYSRILKIIDEYKIGRIIVGMPFSLSGTNTEQTIKTEEFIKKLSQMTNVEIIIQDERYSTVIANRLFSQARIKRSRKGKLLDAASAALILQSYLDSKKKTSSGI